MEKLKFGLSKNILDDIKSVFKKFPSIDSVLLFGSRAKNTYKNGSDIDLAVIAPEMNEQEFAMLWGEIEDLSLVFKIDLLHWNTLDNPKLKQKISSEGIVFYP